MPSSDLKPIVSPSELGQTCRAHRKQQGLTLETLSGVSGLGVRFLSEFERGKPTAEIGKVIEALRAQGLELFVLSRTQMNQISAGIIDPND